MREIKFRAWNPDIKKMFYIPQDGTIRFQTQNFNSTSLIDALSWVVHDNNGASCVYSNRGELMQFTGLQDGYGNEIYGQDIVEVSFWDGPEKPPRIERGRIVFDCGRGHYLWLDNENNAWGLTTKDKANKKIGNVIENPELLDTPSNP